MYRRGIISFVFDGDDSLYYPVTNKLNNRVSKSSFPFGLLCDQALNAAKQWEVAKIQQVLGSEALRRDFMELGLIHYS